MKQNNASNFIKILVGDTSGLTLGILTVLVKLERLLSDRSALAALNRSIRVDSGKTMVFL